MIVSLNNIIESFRLACLFSGIGQWRFEPENLFKSFICPKCGRSYLKERNLKRHVNFECGVAPKLQCPLCSNLFRYSACVKRHLESVHQLDSNVSTQLTRNLK